jgi:hypothetical protein
MLGGTECRETTFLDPPTLKGRKVGGSEML